MVEVVEVMEADWAVALSMSRIVHSNIVRLSLVVEPTWASCRDA